MIFFLMLFLLIYFLRFMLFAIIMVFKICFYSTFLKLVEIAACLLWLLLTFFMCLLLSLSVYSSILTRIMLWLILSLLGGYRQLFLGWRLCCAFSIEGLHQNFLHHLFTIELAYFIPWIGIHDHCLKPIDIKRRVQNELFSLYFYA